MHAPSGCQEVSSRLKNRSHRPRAALVLLCFAQGCERFAFFAAMPLFALYLRGRHGLGESSALLFVGVFNALSYVGAWPASLLTERSLGARTAARLGALLLALGFTGLLWDRAVPLWLSL